jgi:hypothetical protein
MSQIYIVFSLKTTVHVQYFNISGHIIKTCPFYPEIGFHIKDRSRQKVETKNKMCKIYYIDNKAHKKYLASHWRSINS